MNRLEHRTVYKDKSDVLCSYPLTEIPFQDDGSGEFHLTQDPHETKKASIIGMFVLRPSQSSWTGEDIIESMYDTSLSWIYNLDGLDGGCVISNGNPVDAFRLALQYALSDAVIVSTHTVSTEGVNRRDADGRFIPGYIWQPYVLCEWPHLKLSEPALMQKLDRQRCIWQTAGYLSDRRYPAQIVFTLSGERHPSAEFDWLEASIFTQSHPDGTPLEVHPHIIPFFNLYINNLFLLGLCTHDLRRSN